MRLVLFLVCSLLLSGCVQWDGQFRLKEVLTRRPAKGGYLMDYAHLLKYSGEDKEEVLKFLRDRCGIEMFVVTIPSLEGRDINVVASQIFDKWNIGKNMNGRGVLLLLSDKEKLIKLEIGYGLEAVFTDLFCGYIERKQLKRYFENNQVDEGLSAVLEEFIARAEGRLTDREIKKRMQGYLSGGAGIKKEVHIGELARGQSLPRGMKKYFSAQPSPEALFKKYRKVMAKCIGDVDLGIYTESSRVAMRYLPRPSRSICREWYYVYSKPHQIIEKGSYAVLLFPGDKKHGPIFMKRTGEGWQIDILSMAKWIRYDRNNNWFVGGNNHPYMFAFENKEYSNYVQDFEFYDDFGNFSKVRENYDYYISLYESRGKRDPSDFETLLSLAEIFFDLCVAKKAIPLLEKALQLKPSDPRPYRYLGLIYRDNFCAEETALRYLKRYVELAPRNPDGYYYLAVTCWRIASWKDRPTYYDKAAKYMRRYGELSGNFIYAYNWIGYFYYLKGDKKRAQIWFNKTLRLDPSNRYARSRLKELIK